MKSERYVGYPDGTLGKLNSAYYSLDIIASGKFISSLITAQFLTKSNFS